MADNTEGYRDQVRIGDITVITPGSFPNINIKSKKWDVEFQAGKTKGKSTAEMKMAKVMEKLAKFAAANPTKHYFKFPDFLARALYFMGKLEKLGAISRHPKVGPVPNLYVDVIRDLAAYQGHEPLLLQRTTETWARDPKRQPANPQQFQNFLTTLDSSLRFLYPYLDNRLVEPERYYVQLLELFTRGLLAIANMGGQLDNRRDVKK